MNGSYLYAVICFHFGFYALSYSISKNASKLGNFAHKNRSVCNKTK